MTMLRALILIAVLAGLTTAACGGAGSGGPGGGAQVTSAPTTAAPALGTNKPAASPMTSGDPYSDYGY
jgi:hypothetical protein